MGTLEEGMDSKSVSKIQSQIMSARNNQCTRDFQIILLSVINISLDYDGERLKTFF